MSEQAKWVHTHNLVRDGETLPVFNLCGAYIAEDEWPNIAPRYCSLREGFLLDCEEGDHYKAVIEEDVDFTLEVIDG